MKTQALSATITTNGQLRHKFIAAFTQESARQLSFFFFISQQLRIGQVKGASATNGGLPAKLVVINVFYCRCLRGLPPKYLLKTYISFMHWMITQESIGGKKGIHDDHSVSQWMRASEVFGRGNSKSWRVE